MILGIVGWFSITLQDLPLLKDNLTLTLPYIIPGAKWNRCIRLTFYYVVKNDQIVKLAILLFT